MSKSSEDVEPEIATDLPDTDMTAATEPAILDPRLPKTLDTQDQAQSDNYFDVQNDDWHTYHILEGKKITKSNNFEGTTKRIKKKVKANKVFLHFP